MIQMQVDDPIRHALREAHIVIAFKAFDVGGRDGFDQIDITREQSGNPRWP